MIEIVHWQAQVSSSFKIEKTAFTQKQVSECFNINSGQIIAYKM